MNEHAVAEGITKQKTAHESLAQARKQQGAAAKDAADATHGEADQRSTAIPLKSEVYSKANAVDAQKLVVKLDTTNQERAHEAFMQVRDDVAVASKLKLNALHELKLGQQARDAALAREKEEQSHLDADKQQLGELLAQAKSDKKQVVHRQSIADEAAGTITVEKAKIASVQAHGDSLVAKREGAFQVEKSKVDDANLRKADLDARVMQSQSKVSQLEQVQNETTAELKEVEVAIKQDRDKARMLAGEVKAENNVRMLHQKDLANATIETELAKENASRLEQTLVAEKRTVAQSQDRLKEARDEWSQERAKLNSRAVTTTNAWNQTGMQLKHATLHESQAATELAQAEQRGQHVAQMYTQADNAVMDATASVQRKGDEAAATLQTYNTLKEKSLASSQAADVASSKYKDADKLLVREQHKLDHAEAIVAQQAQSNEAAQTSLSQAKERTQAAADRLVAANKGELEAERASEKAEQLRVSAVQEEANAKLGKAAANEAAAQAKEQLADALDVASRKSRFAAVAKASAKDKSRALDNARLAYATARQQEIEAKQTLADNHKIHVDLTTPVHA